MSKKSRQVRFFSRSVVFISGFIFISAVTLAVIRINIINNAIKDEGLTPEQLKVLPYISYTEEKTDRTKSGVIVHDKDRAFEGYNLYGSRLMDMEGNIIRLWRHCGRVGLISDKGYVFAVTCPQKSIGKYAWDSTQIWETKDLKISGHEVVLTPDNTILAPSKEVHEYKGRRVRFGIIVELDQDGNELCRWSTWDNLDYLKQFHKRKPLGKPGIKIRKKRPSPFGGDYDYDYLNSIQALPENPLGKDKRFQKGNWLISLVDTDLVLILILILDKDTKEIVWSFGPGEIEVQHTPRMLDNGNILIFDNGGDKRNYTRIIELNPITKEIVWEYKADPPESFFCKSVGFAQRLPNGNTLIGDGQGGRAFEVTKEGEIVWEWLNPEFNEKGKRESLGRMVRYPKDKIERISKKVAP